jgi:hypothetical protein
MAPPRERSSEQGSCCEKSNVSAPSAKQTGREFQLHPHNNALGGLFEAVALRVHGLKVASLSPELDRELPAVLSAAKAGEPVDGNCIQQVAVSHKAIDALHAEPGLQRVAVFLEAKLHTCDVS